MNSILVPLRSALLVAALVTLGAAGTAGAAGTPSGITISNTATVDYAVSGVNQAQISSNPATFLVDNRVDLTVATVDGAIVVVVPNTSDQVQTFTVTNTGNTTQDFSLTAPHSPTGAFGETESFDALNVRVFVDGNGNGSYDPGTDAATFIDELEADSSVTVFVLADIQATGLVDGDVSSFDLVAQVAAGGSSGSQGSDILTDDSGTGDLPNVVQIVFGDGAGSADAANDGRHSSKDGYKVQTAQLTVAKASLVTNDPINGAAFPLAIPGATVDYTIDVNNTGTVAASTVEVRDQVPANTEFLVGSVTTTPAAGPVVEYSDDGGTTWTYAPVAGGNGADPAVTDVRVTFVSIASGGAGQAVFQVLIQ